MPVPLTRFRPSLSLGLVAGFFLLWACGCNSMKKVPEGESLLVANKVKVKGKGIVSNSDMLNMMAQEPNSRFFGARLKLSLYNWADDQKQNWWNNKLREIGEPPAIFDSSAVSASQERILSYASSKGYFHPMLITEIRRKGKENRKVSVHYVLQLDQPYHIRNISLHVLDDSLRDELSDWKEETILKTGMQYQVSLLDNERKRIAEKLQNHGYWTFNKDHITYIVDSALQSKQMDVSLYVRKMGSNVMDSLTGRPLLFSHKRYKIGDVYIQPQSRSQVAQPSSGFDTILVENITRREKRKGISGPVYSFILNQGKPIIKYKPIIQKTFLKSGDYYSAMNVRKTYDNLGDLRAFQYTNISLSERAYDSSLSFYENNLLDCHIQMIQGSRFGFSIEGQLTTSSGIQGIAANVVFQNRNTFGGGEIFNLKVRGMYELQATLDNNRNRTFLNTFETKVEASLEFPRFLLPVSLDRFSQYFRPTSILSASYSYQHKKDYSRGIFNATFGYHWRQGTMEHILNPIEASTIQMIQTSGSFQAILDEYRQNQNYRLYYQYTDHFILSPRYQFTLNDQKTGEVKDFNHLRLEVEAAGNLLYAIAYAIHGQRPGAAGYEIFGLPFSQYIRAEADYRHHFVFGEKTELVFRSAFGIGYSYGNATSMPYEKSMFIGGNSTLRAWPLYQLGPGSYRHPEGKSDFERLGDLMMVFNLEQRFPIISGLRGAVFLDLGNIWILRPNEAFPGGEFRFDKFYRDFAFGTGFGLRYDFKFFLIRVDIGIPLRDPSLLETGDTWVVKRLKWNDLLFNFGIGYPF